MRLRVLRHRLRVGFDPERAAAALFARHTDSVWLDSGDVEVSYLARGTPVRLAHPVFPSLAVELASLAPEGIDDDIDDDGLADDQPGFRLGLIGWLGYELRGETTGARVEHTSRYPDAAMLRVDRAVAIDGRTGSAQLLALGREWTDELVEWRDSTEHAVNEAMRGQLDPPPIPQPSKGRWRYPDPHYLAMIETAQQAIREGEAYQLCVTNEIETDARPDPFDLYRRLRSASPSHHGALLRIGGVSLVSASPERFLSIDRHGMVETSPIKGTRPRGGSAALDAALSEELTRSEKERAENLMIVDLMRNDLSRVCDPASIEVTSLLQVESYAQVHQLVSTVRGHLAAGVSATDAVAACFPAGSMTGAPKRRATEILDDLEQRARGVYAGAFGYFGVDGAVDLAMVIRSIVVDKAGSTIGSGGGITALSNPVEELEEVRIKAAPLLAALGTRATRSAPREG